MERKSLFRGEIMPEIIKKRCAIYTRKSVEDGLEQDFNSLDNQREAGEAYIASQKGNGWICLPERYDDGGFSGGNMKRPALQKLLADAEAGLIDIIVVYKIDRLSRSICDFAELSKKFDEWNVNFVAVTQDINTSTSSGRMMLHILITFAQYEREIITERVRDKMAASRKKGKWVGGSVALGYKVVDKKLVVVPEEAELVRKIYDRFIEVQSPKLIATELNHAGIKTKQGKLWSPSHIYRMLNNHTYIGEVKYKEYICEGEQEAIVSLDVWNRTRTILAENNPQKGQKFRQETVAPLRGILKCGHCDCAMMPTYGKKNGKKYFYYFCVKDSKRAEATCPVRKFPAGEIEKVAFEQLKAILNSSEIITILSQQNNIPGSVISEYFNNDFWAEISPGEANRLFTLLVEKMVVYDDKLEIELKTAGAKAITAEIWEQYGNQTTQER